MLKFILAQNIFSLWLKANQISFKIIRQRQEPLSTIPKIKNKISHRRGGRLRQNFHHYITFKFFNLASIFFCFLFFIGKLHAPDRTWTHDLNIFWDIFDSDVYFEGYSAAIAGLKKKHPLWKSKTKAKLSDKPFIGTTLHSD